MRAELAARPEAVDLVRRTIRPDDRIVLTGATGWFGRTAIALLQAAFGGRWRDEQVLAVAHRPRAIQVLGVGPVAVVGDDLETLAAFRPSLVLHCAFPTRDRVDRLGHDAYVRAATAVTERLLTLLAVPGLERVVTFSSGAAVPSEQFPADLGRNPYGVLKAREEVALLERASGLGVRAHVSRVWAVSGIHVQRPLAYGFSSIVHQALAGGPIVVTARHPVVRAYAALDDVIALALAAADDGPSIVDTGGTRIELGQLAELVAGACAGARVLRDGYDPGGQADVYVAPGQDFPCLALAHGLALAPLEEQVERCLAAAAVSEP